MINKNTIQTIFKMFFVLIIVISNLYSTQLNPVPVIKFDELTFDFGNIPQGTELEHIFSFTNEGDGKLVITGVQPACGCTGATIGDKKEFQNGETGEIKVTFNTQGRTGNIEKSVNVTTNDPSHPQVTLKFICNIK